VTVLKMFEQYAISNPEKIAAVVENSSITYGILNDKASYLASYLKKNGVTVETLVATYLDRSFDAIIAMLAILKASGAFVPIDKNYPKERCKWILEDASPKFIITDSTGHTKLQENNALVENKILCIDEIIEHLSDNLDSSTQEPHLKEDSRAYVIYTSGSTGRPKGVMVEHHSFLNLVKWQTKAFNVTDKIRTTQFTSLGFDFSLWEMWPSLCNGATIYFIPEAIRTDANKIQRYLLNNHIKISFMPTPLGEELLSLPWPSVSDLDYLLTGGSQLKVWPRKGLPFKLINNYGPTENTMISTSSEIMPSKNPHEVLIPPTIGKPIDGVCIEILDKNGAPCNEGELYLSGKNVARGYLNDESMTSQKFVTSNTGTRYYRTGDLVYLNDKGELVFKGRIDKQIKINGKRVELGEIEYCINKIKGITNAIVRQKSLTNNKQILVAYLLTDNDTEISIDQIIKDLSSLLSRDMIPSEFRKLDSLPLSQHDKVIDEKLDEFSERIESRDSSYVKPTEKIGAQIASLAEETLNTKPIGLHENLFALGCTSLNATSLCNKINRELNVNLTPQDIYQNPTVELLIELINNSPDTKSFNYPEIELLDRKNNKYFPISFQQQQLYTFHHNSNNLSLCNEPLTFRLNTVQSEILELAIRNIIKHHEILRTAFVQIGNELYQEIKDDIHFELNKLDLSDIDQSEQESTSNEYGEEELILPFNLKAPPLFRAVLVKFNENDYRLYMAAHHIIIDGFSYVFFMKELEKEYLSLLNPNGSLLSSKVKEIQYVDYANWQRQNIDLSSPIISNQLAYWEQKLFGLNKLEFPCDYVRNDTATRKGTNEVFVLSNYITNELEQFSQENQVTLFSTLVAIYLIALYKFTRAKDIAIGIFADGRNSDTLEHVIGYFINPLVFRLDISNISTFKELVAEVHSTIAEINSNKDIPFEWVVNKLNPVRLYGENPFFNVGITYEPQVPMTSLGWEMSQIEVHSGTSKFDLNIEFDRRSEGLLARLEYNTSLFDPRTIQSFSQCYQTIVSKLLKNPSTLKIDPLTVISEDGISQLEKWNDTKKAFPPKCIHNLFEEQAQTTPNEKAVIFGNDKLTYKQLNHLANNFSKYLADNGVKTGDRVVIFMERSLELVVSMLAALKTGAIYIPIAAELHESRVNHILCDSQANIIITNNADIKKLTKNSKLMLIHANEVLAQIKNAPYENSPSRTVTLDDPAYIIYTSGSTGMPKGACNTHRGFSNRILWMQDKYKLDNNDSVIQKTPISFDVSGWEFFWPLATGATLVIAEPGVHKDPVLLAETIINNKITVAHFVPSMLNVFLASPQANKCSLLKKVFCSGEALSLEDAEMFHMLLPDTELHNLYGPTEAAIDVTFYHCRQNANYGFIPIGKPISNTQIYILDKHMQRLPFGAVGEIYIGGIGVGLGYWNNPELTNGSFLKNPFGTNSLLYKTGDLARFLPNGDIKYLGRNDNQVKIRGNRIELGEIENSIRQTKLVNSCAVVLHQAHKELVAYIAPTDKTSNTPKDKLILKIKFILKEKLPHYMIPAYFSVLNQLPITPNGKLDRKALLDIPVSEKKHLEYFIKPRTKTEAKLCIMLQSLLSIESISISDNFFDVGLTSLNAARLSNKITETWSKPFYVRDIYNNPSVDALASVIDNRATDFTLVHSITHIDFDNGSKLNLDFSPSKVSKKGNYSKPKNVLLTGATGYLGAFLLKELISETNSHIYCLVRADNEEHGLKRVFDNLLTLKIPFDQDILSKRITILTGDLRLDYFGWGSELYNKYAKLLDLIYHCAAEVNLAKTYDDLKFLNVDGVYKIIQFATTETLKMINYVSSIGAFGVVTKNFEPDRVYSEDVDISKMLHYIQGETIGYNQCKWVSEMLVIQAKERGVPINIFRPGLYLCHSQTGVSPKNSYWINLLNTCINMRTYPKIKQQDRFVTIDFVSKAIAYLSLRSISGNIYHLLPDDDQHDVNLMDLCKIISKSHTGLDEIEYKAWVKKLLAIISENQYQHPLAPLLYLFTDEISPGMTSIEILEYLPKFKCKFTVNELRESSIRWQRISDEILMRCITETSEWTAMKPDEAK
jgi:amino acid adenylation domain-containing protein/thioester reductase-like protein